MKTVTKIFVIILIVIFVIGIAFCLNPQVNRENLVNMMQGETLEKVETGFCPDLLIRSGNELHLYNSKLPRSDTNPLKFENLDKYLEYLEKQRKQNIRCPVLFLQEESNTQGERVYRSRPSPMEMNPGGSTAPIEVMDASRYRKEFNQNMFAGFDAHGQHVGQNTELDVIHQSTEKANISDNPMDTNWGGVLYSQQTVESGKYADREVAKPTMVPKVIEKYK